MAQLNFYVKNQIITRDDCFMPVARSQNYLKAAFKFSNDWNDITKIAIFTVRATTYEVILDDNGECTVPWEALTDPGILEVSVYGGDRITANCAKVEILKTGYTEQITSTRKPSVDVFEKLIGKIDDLSDAMNPRVSSLNDTVLAGPEVIEAAGIPVYVSDVAEYSTFGITETGWYIFARIAAKDGVTVSDATTVTGATGYIAESGADHIDVAVKFEVAAMSGVVNITWDADNAETFVFKATDLAIRNLDYRVTFYVYDIDDFATWEYALTPDTTFVGTEYYILENGTYVRAAVKANDAVPADTYYVHSYVLTEDTTFVEGKTYYTKSGTVYTAAEITAGEEVTANTYYEDKYTLTTDVTFVGNAYYTKDGDIYSQAAVKAGDPIPCYYVGEPGYVLTTDTAFVEGTTYYTKSGDEYTVAEVTVGAAVTANTYYVLGTVYKQTTDETAVSGTTYYAKSDNVYSPVMFTVGSEIPAFYKHSKVTFEGMTRNITYRCNTPIDCPMVFNLPEIEDETHGCWYEIRFQHTGSFSSTLNVPKGVKVATEHTQAETKGMNMVDLHYTSIGDLKLWRFMNTHSSIPA